MLWLSIAVLMSDKGYQLLVRGGSLILRSDRGRRSKCSPAVGQWSPKKPYRWRHCGRGTSEFPVLVPASDSRCDRRQSPDPNLARGGLVLLGPALTESRCRLSDGPLPAAQMCRLNNQNGCAAMLRRSFLTTRRFLCCLLRQS